MAWEPYCLSLRIINWVKWFSTLDRDPNQHDWHISLFQQVLVLETKLEYELMCNHLFSNAKALIFAGAYFGGVEGKRFTEKGKDFSSANF